MHSPTAIFRLLMLLAAAAVVPWAVAIALAGTALAGDAALVGSGNAEHARAELLVGVDSVAPGTPFPVGVRLTMDPGWHVYWKYPGTAGLPTTVDFHLPDGYAVGPLQYPTPAEFDQPGGIVGYGYEKSVLLTAIVTPPADLTPGSAVPISAEVAWLVCADVCIPGRATVDAVVPVTGGEAAKRNPAFDAPDAATPVAVADDRMVLSVSTAGSLDAGNLRATVLWAVPPQEAHWLATSKTGPPLKTATPIRWIPAVPDGLIAGRPTVTSDIVHTTRDDAPADEPYYRLQTVAEFTFDVYDRDAADAAIKANWGVIDTVLTYRGIGGLQGVAIPVPLDPEGTPADATPADAYPPTARPDAGRP